MNDNEVQDTLNTITDEDRETMFHYARLQSERVYSEYRKCMHIEISPTVDQRIYIAELILTFCYSTEDSAMFEEIDGLGEKAIEFLDFAYEYLDKWGYLFTSADKREMNGRLGISCAALQSYSAKH